VSQESTNRSFDDLARGLANGSISRRKAIKFIAATTLGGILGLSGIGTAFAKNKTCAQWCAAVFGANTPAAGQCASDAAHGTGLCSSSSCGPATPPSSVCCTRNSSGNCTSYSGASCCGSSATCLNGSCCAIANVCGSTCCALGQTCLNGSCCPSEQVCGSTCGCPAGQVCSNGFCCPPGYVGLGNGACARSGGNSGCSGNNCLDVGCQGCTSEVGGGGASYCRGSGALSACTTHADCDPGQFCGNDDAFGSGPGHCYVGC
jgi:hypothetical protein